MQIKACYRETLDKKAATIVTFRNIQIHSAVKIESRSRNFESPPSEFQFLLHGMFMKILTAYRKELA